MYQLQRRVRVLREQVQRRDLHLELLKRKLAIIEDGARGKCILQGERDDAVCRAKKASKQIDKLTAQLVDAKSQIAEARSQLAEAVEYKVDETYLVMWSSIYKNSFRYLLLNVPVKLTNLLVKFVIWKKKRLDF